MALPLLLFRYSSLMSVAYSRKILNLFGSSIVGHWPLDDPIGSTVARDISGNGYNGTPSNVTFGAAGMGDGHTAASFNGTNSRCNIYSAGLDGAFDGAEGTAMVWAKVSAAGVWTDAALRFLFIFYADFDNQIYIYRTTTDNELVAAYKAGGTEKSVVLNPISSVGWMHLSLTWSASGDALKVYYNGSQYGTTQTSLGVWAGTLNSNQTNIGAYNATPDYEWSGFLAYTILTNTAATPAQIAQAASI